MSWPILNRVAIFKLTVFLILTGAASAAELKVMKTGLGEGRVTSMPSGINCGSDCDFTFGSEMVTLTAVPEPGPESDPGSLPESDFEGWDGAGISCPGTGSCTIDMNAAKAVRAKFSPDFEIPPLTQCGPMAESPNDCSPQNIRDYLDANPKVNTVAEFVKALPPLFKENWILMSRSESLQTGTAQSPRILLPSHDARFVFSIGLTEHDSFPGSFHTVIEYMQWDSEQKNFRFHEIVLDTAPDMHMVGGAYTFPERRREVEMDDPVTADDPKCTKCHSTQNVPNTSTSYGTAPQTATRGESTAKNKPNWDAYDSWAGMLPFNRDRIYQGSADEAAFRSFFNLWNWRGSVDNDRVRQITHLLELQPLNLTSVNHSITRDIDDVMDAGHIEFGFEKSAPPDAPSAGGPPNTTNYNFNNQPGSGTVTTVNQEARYVTLRHSGPPGFTPITLNENLRAPASDEGRGVQLFDLIGGLDGQLNATRIADELINHHYGTSDFEIDVRPIALAIARGYITISSASNRIVPEVDTDFDFFNDRNGLTIPGFNSINDLVADTRVREESLPRRKADVQKFNLDRITLDGSDIDGEPDPDPYLVTADIDAVDSRGLIQEYVPGFPSDIEERRDSIRREIFRRSIDIGDPDRSDIGRVAVDREDYPTETRKDNSQTVALFRYFLEPLGVSVDKWSMNVRGRSRAYNFADVFNSFKGEIARLLEEDLSKDDRKPVGVVDFDLSAVKVLEAVDKTLAPSNLPDVPDTMANVPTFTAIQRIFNKSCIECHGGLNYPPYYNHGYGLDLSEQEGTPSPPLLDPRWNRLENSYTQAAALVSPFTDSDLDGDYDEDDDGVMDNGGGFLYRKIARLTNEDCPHDAAGVTRGMMPCGGPSLSQADIQTIERWIGAIDEDGVPPKTAGDPHIHTINGINYDFQAAGEFVLLNGPGLEVQARQTAVQGTAPYGPNDHTGLSSCVSVNGAVAMRMGNDRVTYQPGTRGSPSPDRLELRIDGKLWKVGSNPVPLPSGGRIVRTSTPGGIQVEAAGGTKVVVTPFWWSAQQLWIMTIDLYNARGTQGLMGAILPQNWLPALPDNSLLGPIPQSLDERYELLYDVFGEAWRVNDGTSLFDYELGTSTNTFTFKSWPNGESPQSCFLPSGGPDAPPQQAPPPVTPMPRAEAEEHCSAVTDPVQRDNCIGDVAITGEIGFATTYLNSQKVQDNRAPAEPALIFPQDDAADLLAPVSFQWNSPEDPDGDNVNFRHCIWSVNQRFNGNECIFVSTTPTATDPDAGTMTNISENCTRILLILAILLLIVLTLMALGRKRTTLSWIAILLLAVLAITFWYCSRLSGSSTVTNAVANLEPGNAYFWKIIVDDGKGGSVESETYRFELKE